MKALRIYAGPAAREHIAANGLRPQDVRTVPGAAGGPKGLILGPIDRFLFGDWLPQSNQPVDLVGASIGAWRLANACLQDTKDANESVPGGGIVAGIGFVSGVRCMVVASDSGIEAGAIQPMGLEKILRVQEIALANKIPFD